MRRGSPFFEGFLFALFLVAAVASAVMVIAILVETAKASEIDYVRFCTPEACYEPRTRP